VAEVCGHELDESKVVIAHYCVVNQCQIDFCRDLWSLSLGIRRTINVLILRFCTSLFSEKL